jgi:glycerophosphoryl diester phosphodiesterase
MRPIGVYPETKHPTYFQGLGLALEPPLVEALHRWGYRGRDAPVFIQSFEFGNLQDIRHSTEVPLIMLINSHGAPFDFVASGDKRSYADLLKPTGLAQIATFANGLGVATGLMIPTNAAGKLGPPTELLTNAHAAGLAIHGWTFRAENHFLPTQFRQGDDPAALGDLAGMIRAFLAAGMDGFFTDHPYIGRLARDEFLLSRR